MISDSSFPVVSFVKSPFLVVGATFSYLDTINPKIEHRTRVRYFKQDRFTSVFANLDLEASRPLLWGLIL